MTLLLATVTGCLVVAGLGALAFMGVRPAPRLGDALDLLDGRRPEPLAAEPGIGRLGAWLRRHTGAGITADTGRRLRIVGTSVDRHLAHKAICGFAGLVLPSAAGGWMAWLSGVPSAVPFGLGLGGAVLGFFLPDVRLRQRDRAVTADATEALLTFFDLVILERLANRSGSQALRAAAEVSHVPVFRVIAEVLEQARLEQRAPYSELQRLGSELGLPALVDVADVMRLDESGAALSGALRARVKELRDAHLMAMRQRAAELSERMGVLMVIPTLEFGLLFLVPPLLRLVSG